MSQLLDKINTPEDLRRLRVEELPLLCDELRREVVNDCAVNPGHFASSLGALELTVALHYVFDTPEDRIVWDVGHQAYPHKILTGRREAFKTNRKLHGLKPFPSPEESSMIPLPADMPQTASPQLSVWRWQRVSQRTKRLRTARKKIMEKCAMSW